MKVTSKLSIVFFLLCLIVTCFNCQNDDDNTQSKQNTDQSRYSIKVVDRAFFKDKPDLSRKLNSMNSKPKGKNKSNSGLNREIYNEEYGFTIETDYVKYIEDLQTGYHSYSFPIVKDYPEDDKVENLVFHSNDNESYDAYIVKYGFTKDEYEILDQEQLKDLSTKYTSIIFDDIEFPTSEDSNRVSMDLECVKVWAYMLVPNNEGELVGGEPLYTHEWVMIAMECDWVTTTDGGGSDSSGGTSGGTSGPDNGPHGNGVVIPQYPILSSPNVIQPWQEVVHCVNSISEAGTTDSTTLTPEMINWLKGADKYTVNPINNFLGLNNCSEEAQIFAVQAIDALISDECGFLPNNGLSQLTTPYNENLFGDYPDSSQQQDHEAIKQQFQQLLANNDNLTAVNYLINTYSMEVFGLDNINVNYTISFSNNVPEGDAVTIGEYDSVSGNLISCEIILENDLLTNSDFGYITRAIKHELYHVLQNQYFGFDGISNAAKEFDAYFSSIFRFNNLPRITEPNKIIQLVVWLEQNWDIMPEREKSIRQDQYDTASRIFPKICND